jgi:hypothetical protein
VFLAQHIWTGEGFFGTGRFGKIVANVPIALQALNLGFSRLFGVDWGTWKQCLALVVLTGLLAAYSTIANVKQKINDHRFPCVAANMIH